MKHLSHWACFSFALCLFDLEHGSVIGACIGLLMFYFYLTLWCWPRKH